MLMAMCCACVWPCAVHVCGHVLCMCVCVCVFGHRLVALSVCVCGRAIPSCINRSRNNFTIVCGCIEMCCTYARNPYQ